MFGYIRPCEPELKVRELNTYKAYYCGLCKCIDADYSFLCRFFLNYDCAFLYLLTSAVMGSEAVVEKEGCIKHPGKRPVARAPEADYAAGINLLLARGKLLDSFADDKNIFAKAASLLFSSAFKKADRHYHEAALAIDAHLKNLSELERGGCPSIDAPSNEFGALLAEVVSGAPFDWLEEDAEQNLYDFAFNLGKWIYLVDAVDDIKKDLKRGSYNPIALRYNCPPEGGADCLSENREDILNNLLFPLSQASFYYSKLNIKQNRGLLDNVMYAGLPGVTRRVVEGSMDGSV